jgi:lysophospholipase L1-like esterase
MRIKAAILIVLLVPVTHAAQQQAPAASQVQQPGAQAMPSCPELANALTALIRNARDWANLGRYRDANRALGPSAAAAPPAPGGRGGVEAGEARVVFMGDSITDSWPQARFGDFFAGKPYVGRGISGQTTPQMLVRFRPDVIDLKPKVVVILAGTNDIAGNTGPMTNEEIQANLASMCELAKVHGIRVVLGSILPVSAYHTSPTGAPQTVTRPMTRIRAINDWIKAYAAAEGHVYLDYFSAMVDATGVLREELSADDLHPNAKGYAIMGPLAEAAIKQALR